MSNGRAKHRDYLESGCWKCQDSPTGAHHWIELPSKKKVNSGLFQCKYCKEYKPMPIHFGGALKASGIRRIPSQRIGEITVNDMMDLPYRPSKGVML